MVNVTRLNGTSLVINSELIETIEETPDTIITLTNGNKYVVAEAAKQLIESITEFRKRCNPIVKYAQGGKEIES